MKKLYSLFLMALLSIVGMQAATFTVNVAENVGAESVGDITVGYYRSMWGMEMPQPYTTQCVIGDNVFEIKSAKIYISIAETLPATVKLNGVNVDDRQNIYVNDGDLITIERIESGEAAHATVTVDVPSRVGLTVGERAVELSSVTDVEFDAITERNFSLASLDAANPIVKVLYNGSPVSVAMDGRYNIQGVTDGAEINVTTVEVKYPVTFSFSDEHAREYISSVAVNYSLVDNYADGLEVAEGKMVTMEVNTSISDVTVKINGVETKPHILFNNIEFAVTEATTVEVTTNAAPPVAETFSVSVDHAAYVKVGYSKIVNNGWYPQVVKTYFNLTDGDNELDMPEDVNSIFVEPASSDYEIVSVTADGTALESWDSIALTAGLALVIESKKTDPVGYITVKCDDYTRVAASIRGDNGERNVELDGNEAQVGFYATDMTLVIAAKNYDQPIVSVTADGNPVAVSGGYYLIEPLVDGKVVEVKAIAAKRSVTFNFSDEHAREYITNVTIQDVPVANFAEGFEVDENTDIVLALNSSISDVKVTVEGAEPISIPGSIVMNVKEDVVINVTTTAPASIVLNLDHAEYVTVGWKKANAMFPWIKDDVLFEGLHDGINDVEIPADCTSIFVRPADSTCSITSIHVDGEPVDAASYEEIPVADGMVVSVLSDGEVSGIESIEADGAAEYYTLDGVRVERPAAGVYVVVRGGKSAKVLVK